MITNLRQYLKCRLRQLPHRALQERRGVGQSAQSSHPSPMRCRILLPSLLCQFINHLVKTEVKFLE